MDQSAGDWSLSTADIMSAESPALRVDKLRRSKRTEPPSTDPVQQDQAHCEGQSSIMLKYADEIRASRSGVHTDAPTHREPDRPVTDRRSTSPQIQRAKASPAGNSTKSSKDDSFLRFSFEGFKFINGQLTRDVGEAAEKKATGTPPKTSEQTQPSIARDEPAERPQQLTGTPQLPAKTQAESSEEPERPANNSRLPRRTANLSPVSAVPQGKKKGVQEQKDVPSSSLSARKHHTRESSEPKAVRSPASSRGRGRKVERQGVKVVRSPAPSGGKDDQKKADRRREPVAARDEPAKKYEEKSNAGDASVVRPERPGKARNGHITSPIEVPAADDGAAAKSAGQASAGNVPAAVKNQRTPMAAEHADPKYKHVTVEDVPTEMPTPVGNADGGCKPLPVDDKLVKEQKAPVCERERPAVADELDDTPDDLDLPELSSVSDGDDDSPVEPLGGPEDFTGNIVQYLKAAADWKPSKDVVAPLPGTGNADAHHEPRDEPVENEPAAQPQHDESTRNGSVVRLHRNETVQSAPPAQSRPDGMKSATEALSKPKTADVGGEMLAAIMEETKRLTEMRIADETEKALLRAELASQRKEIDRLQGEADKAWREQSLIAAEEEERHYRELVDRECEVDAMREEMEQMQENFIRDRDMQLLGDHEEKDIRHREMEAKVMQVADLKKDLRQIQSEATQLQEKCVAIVAAERERHQVEMEARDEELEVMKMQIQSEATQLQDKCVSIVAAERERHQAEMDVRDEELEVMKMQMELAQGAVETNRAKHAAEMAAVTEQMRVYKAEIENRPRDDDESPAEKKVEAASRAAQVEEMAAEEVEEARCRAHDQQMAAEQTEAACRVAHKQAMAAMEAEAARRRADDEATAANQAELHRSELASRDAEIASLKQEVERLRDSQTGAVERKHLQRLETELIDKDMEIACLDQEAERLRDSQTGAVDREKLQRLETELEDKDMDIISLKQEVEHLRDSQTGAVGRRELQHLETELKDKDTDIVSLKQEIERLRDSQTGAVDRRQLQHLETELKDKDTNIVSLKQEVERLRGSLSGAVDRKQLQRLDTELIDKDMEIASLDQELERLRGSQEGAVNKEQLQRLETESKDKDMDIVGLKNEVRRLRSEAERVEEGHKERLGEQQELYRGKLQRKDVRINGLRHDMKRLQVAFEQGECRQSEIAAEESKRNRQVTTGLSSQIEELQQQLRHLESSKDRETRMTAVKFDKAVQRATNAAVKAVQIKHTRETDALKGQLQAARDAETALKSANEHASRELEARYAAAASSLDQKWSDKYKALKKEREVMAKALMHQWGKEELGSAGPQHYKYKFSKKATA